MERYYVGLCQQSLHIDGLNAALLEMVQRHVRVYAYQAHPPRAQQLRDTRPDAAQADDADGDAFVAIPAATEVGSLVGLVAPTTGLHLLVALPEALEQREHYGHGALGHAAPVRLCGSMGHHDAELGRGVDVYVVDADGVLGDDAQIRRRFEDASGDR